MAFDQAGLFLGRGVYNACRFGNAPAWHSYASTTDTVSTILGNNYFPEKFAREVDGSDVRPGDIIYLSGSDTQSINRIIAISPSVILGPYGTSGNTSTVINTTTVSGIWASPITNVSMRSYNTGHLTTVFCPTTLATVTSGTVITFNVSSQSAFDFQQPVVLTNGGGLMIGQLDMFLNDTLVQLQIVSGGPFTPGVPGGFEAFEFTYINNS